MSEDEAIIYTRNQPIWWHRRQKEPEKALFIAYRNKSVVIDVLFPDGSTQHKIARLEAIQPREETNEGQQE